MDLRTRYNFDREEVCEQTTKESRETHRSLLVMNHMCGPWNPMKNIEQTNPYANTQTHA